MTKRYLVALLLAAGAAQCAELKEETLEAWRQYVQSAQAKMQARLAGPGQFLDLSAQQERLGKVKNGEIVVFPTEAKGVIKVPGGLIHDWLGAAFIPNTTLTQLLSVLRNYERYPEFYKPTVIETKVIAKEADSDRFKMVLLNKSLFLKAALDSDYRCSYFRVTDTRWYSLSETTRLQEVENYGTPNQRALDENKGSGFIWRLFSIARFEEADGGVYVELEAMALSRGIPGSLRLFVDPIVARVSRGALTTSLRQTKVAAGNPDAALSSANQK